MAIELERLIKKVEHMDIRLLAGKEGLNHPVSWVHMVESVASSDFLDGGQLVFTTGIGLNSSADLTDLIKATHKKNVAGMIVNIGPYLEKVPQEAIDFCNENDYPLFEVPWKIHLAEIMRICCFAITKEEQRMMETSAAFKNAIFFPQQEELYVVPLSQRNFRVNWQYSVSLIRLTKTGHKLEERLEALCMSLENAIRHSNKNAAIFVNDAEIIIVYTKLDEDRLRAEVTEARRKAHMLLLPGEEIAMGVGRLTKSIRCIYKSYNQAKAIEKLQEQGKIGPDKIFYADLGIYRLLMGIEDREIMQDYYDATLKKLVEYDSVNGTDLCQTLQTYLKNDGSVKETAEELFVHRNTINYKLNKVEELLNLEMSSLSARMELMIAFHLRDIL